MPAEHPQAGTAKVAAADWLSNNRANLGLKMNDAIQRSEVKDSETLTVSIAVKDQTGTYRYYYFFYTISNGTISLVTEW